LARVRFPAWGQKLWGQKLANNIKKGGTAMKTITAILIVLSLIFGFIGTLRSLEVKMEHSKAFQPWSIGYLYMTDRPNFQNQVIWKNRYNAELKKLGLN
jgi:hypothetical protein